VYSELGKRKGPGGGEQKSFQGKGVHDFSHSKLPKKKKNENKLRPLGKARRGGIVLYGNETEKGRPPKKAACGSREPMKKD